MIVYGQLVASVEKEECGGSNRKGSSQENGLSEMNFKRSSII